MARAARKSITNADLGTLIPEKYEIAENSMVRVSLSDEAGDMVIYTMDFADMVTSVNLATALFNSNVSRTMRLAYQK